MTMSLFEREFDIPAIKAHKGLLAYLRQARIAGGLIPVRVVLTKTSASTYHGEFSAMNCLPSMIELSPKSIFEFRHRVRRNMREFNVVLMIPTGIGAKIGGHAGDAGPVSQMLAEVSDTLILHPNVVNASDINEMPQNALYVEGSILTRLLMGTVGLESVRSNRILVVIDAHQDELFINAAVNTVNGARATYGLSCPNIICLDPPIKLKTQYSPSGRASGQVELIEGLCALLEEHAGEYDAVAISSVIDVPHEFHLGYFHAGGEMVNPWGGVEAMLTHTLSSIYNIPTAHSPMFESREIANMDPGIVDPRMAAEAISMTFLQCVLKGLQRSPRIVTDTETMKLPGIFTAEDIACLVIPDGCLGLPTLAALEQGITVIAVRENRNLMKNELSSLPWHPKQFYQVDNYWEAVGLIAAIRAGIDPTSVRRPLTMTSMSKFIVSDKLKGSINDKESQ